MKPRASGFRTEAVLAGAYRGKDVGERSLLTHAVDLEHGTVLCGKVNPDHLTDDGRGETVPTCDTCRRRLQEML